MRKFLPVEGTERRVLLRDVGRGTGIDGPKNARSGCLFQPYSIMSDLRKLK